MRCKCVCPVCGDVVKTYSTNNFRHCGSLYSTKANLLAGEEAKYGKMMAKHATEDKKEAGARSPIEKVIAKKKEEEEKPVEEVISGKQPGANPVSPKAIIEEKEPPKRKPVKRRAPKVEEKMVEKTDIGEGWGFF